MANPTLEQHPATPPPAHASRDDRRLGDLIRRRPEPLIAIAVLVLATLFVVWARTLARDLTDSLCVDRVARCFW